MKKQERDLFNSQMDNIIPIMNDHDLGKIEFVKKFLKENFQVEDFEDSFIDFDRMEQNAFCTSCLP
jgi:hypothetical protein